MIDPCHPPSSAMPGWVPEVRHPIAGLPKSALFQKLCHNESPLHWEKRAIQLCVGGGEGRIIMSVKIDGVVPHFVLKVGWVISHRGSLVLDDGGC